MLDLVIRGGTVVTAGSLSQTDVGVQEARVVQLGGDMTGRRELDARDQYVLPGGVDIHVHLSSPFDPGPGRELWVDDFYTGSLAAIAGGVTTLGNMTFQRDGETLRQSLDRDLQAAGRDAAIDYILHPVLTNPTPESLAEIPALAAEGHTSLKIFLVMDSFDRQVDDYLEAVQLAARHGMLTLFHCEDGALIRCVCRELLQMGRTDARHFPASRPVFAEVAATERAIAIARALDAPIYIVHLSSARALDSCRRARADGLPVYVETRPLYLYLTSERFQEPDAAKYAGAPPLREPEDLRAMWNGLHSGDIQCVCTDHAPWTLRQKLDPTRDATNLRQGVADLETMLPMLFSEGVRTGRISLSRFIELTCTNTAKLFGLYPQKGTVAVGSDADLVVWNPQTRRVVDGATMQSRAGYSVYDGREVVGWPRYVVSRGDVVLDEGEITAPRGRGRWVRRGPMQRL